MIHLHETEGRLNYDFVALYGLRGKEYRYKSLSPSNRNNPINPGSDIILIQAFYKHNNNM
jgi:hypothetical protein